jgi:hypothetical protein
MHRNRVWSFTSPVFRLNRNRLVSIDGYVPALDLIQWSPPDYGSPPDYVILEVFSVNIPITNLLPINNTLQPVALKWDVVSGGVPRGTGLRWSKNGGVFNTWTRNVFTNTTFTSGDTIRLAVTTGDRDGTFSFALYNSLDNLVCSTPFSVSVVLV